MSLMVCMRGEPEQLSFLAQIAELGAGIELGSYGLIGVRSEQDWQGRFARHQTVRAQFHGTVAMHGPFIGIRYGHIDHLIRDAMNRRLDMTFDVAVKLKASRVILHSGYPPEMELFKLQDLWLQDNIGFWKQEIRRWADAGIQIAIENETDRIPDLLVRLVNEVNDPFLGLCFDIGHQNLFSEVDAPEWVRRMGNRLYHIHLHDNDGVEDKHWPLGRGTIDFEPFYTAVVQHAPQATISLEMEDKLNMEVKLAYLRNLAPRFGHPFWHP